MNFGCKKIFVKNLKTQKEEEGVKNVTDSSKSCDKWCKEDCFRS
jgi:hypothetical protein